MEKLLKKISLYIFLIILGTIFVVLLFEYPDKSNQFGTIVLSITLGVLVIYTHDTQRIANESVKQTELQTMPILALYIRNVTGIDDPVKRTRVKEYAITNQGHGSIDPSNFYLAIRNMGNGPAFNVNIESNEFYAEKYQTRFYGPKNDEHAVKIVKKPSNKIRDVKEVNGATFLIKCESATGKKYEYRHKVVDIEQKNVELMSLNV